MKLFYVEVWAPYVGKFPGGEGWYTRTNIMKAVVPADSKQAAMVKIKTIIPPEDPEVLAKAVRAEDREGAFYYTIHIRELHEVNGIFQIPLE